MKRRNPITEAHRQRHSTGRGAGPHSPRGRPEPDDGVLECTVGHFYLASDGDCPHCTPAPE